MDDKPEFSFYGAFRTIVGSIDLSALKRSYDDSPNWVAPLFHYMQYIEQDQLFMHCAKRGVETFVLLTKGKGLKELKDEDQRIRRRVAQKEIDYGFPAINAHYTSQLWNMLDATLDDMFALLFLCNSSMLQVSALKRVRVRVADYEGLSKLNRMRFVVKGLKWELASKGPPERKCGVQIFEQMFHEFGVKAAPPQEATKALSELRPVRNVIVHNMSIADGRLVEQCPWLRFSVGDDVRVSDSQYKNYVHAAGLYLVSTLSRVRDSFPSIA